MNTILAVLLQISHFLYGLTSSLKSLLRAFRGYCSELRHGKDARTDVEVLLESSKAYHQLPGHLVVVLGNHDLSVVDFVRLIGWCVTLGIPCLSFYDHTGNFLSQKRDGDVKREFIKSRPDIVDLVDWNQSFKSPVKNGTNGIRRKTRILFLSYSDGKEEIVSLTKDLTKAVSLGTLKVSEITMDLLEEKLRFHGIPDPDVAFICGETYSTYGLLPWHIRTTEFFTLPIHHKLAIKDFVHLLDRYNQCEQRYGK